MAFELTVTADLLSQKTNIEPQIILEIDGIDLVFGAIKVTKIAKYGDDIEYGESGLVYGGVIEDPNQRDYISLKSTTTTRLRQQIDPEKDGATSVQRFKILLVDKNQELSKAFQPGNIVNDILSRKAKVYINFKNGAHPEDSTQLIDGIVDTIIFGPGTVELTVAHPEQLKRTDLFQQIQGQIPAGIDDTVTTIDLGDVTGLILPGDDLRSAVRIDDEVIEFTGISSTSITGAIRGALGTTAASHSIDADWTSFYILEGKPMAMALKLMLSGHDLDYAGSPNAANFVQVTPLINTPNGIFFPITNLDKTLGLVVDDLVSITGATNAANNITEKQIKTITNLPTGTVFVVDNTATLVVETDSAAVATFKSQFNVLNEGAGLNPNQVDVERHLFWDSLLPNSFVDYTFYLKDTENAKDFINSEVYFPQGFYPIPRKGRASVNYALPPLVEEESPNLNIDNVIQPDKLKNRRTINKDFFNAIVYKYEEDVLEERLLAGEITQSATSTNRIDTVNKPLVIESRGLRRGAATDTFITKQTKKFLDRYQFGGERIPVKTNYKTGFKLEVGDVVVFGDDQLQISDINKGSRNFDQRLMEIVNKSIDLKKAGSTQLTLLDTAFDLNGRFGVISPSSFIGPGATTTNIPLKKSYSTKANQEENFKWQRYIGEKVLVHSEDYSFQETVTFVEFDPVNANSIIVSPALSVAPPEDYTVDMPFYPQVTDSSENKIWKITHCFWNPEVTVVSGASGTSFDVGAADIGKFFVGAIVRVRSPDFLRDSNPTLDSTDIIVTNVGATTITVSPDMGFTPLASDLVNLIGFIDEGKPYRYLG